MAKYFDQQGYIKSVLSSKTVKLGQNTCLSAASQQFILDHFILMLTDTLSSLVSYILLISFSLQSHQGYIKSGTSLKMSDWDKINDSGKNYWRLFQLRSRNLDCASVDANLNLKTGLASTLHPLCAQFLRRLRHCSCKVTR